MRAITMFRAAAWLGTAVVFWSLNVRWGTNLDLPNGPPGQWERLVVGAGVLSLLAALAISVSGRKGNPPSWTARGIGLASALLVIGIALHLRSTAQAVGFTSDLLGGQGWTWLLAGGGLVLGAVAGTLGLKPKAGPRKPRRRR